MLRSSDGDNHNVDEPSKWGPMPAMIPVEEENIRHGGEGRCATVQMARVISDGVVLAL